MLHGESSKSDAIRKAALRLVFDLYRFDSHAEIRSADCGLLPVRALISAAKLCWKVRLYMYPRCLLSVCRWPSILLQPQGESALLARNVEI